MGGYFDDPVHRACLAAIGLRCLVDGEGDTAIAVLSPPADGFGPLVLFFRADDDHTEVRVSTRVLKVPPAHYPLVARHLTTLNASHKIKWAVDEDREIVADILLFLPGVVDLARHFARAVALVVASVHAAAPGLLHFAQPQPRQATQAAASLEDQLRDLLTDFE